MAPAPKGHTAPEECIRLCEAAHSGGKVETAMRLRALQELAANLSTENLLLMAASATGEQNLGRIAASLRQSAESLKRQS